MIGKPILDAGSDLSKTKPDTRRYARVMKRFFLTVFLSIWASCAAAREPFETLEVVSHQLGETREILISYPEGYARDGSLPIVVVTDANSQFDLVRSYLRNQSGTWKRLPEMVVVGVVNTNRNRDFLPREDARFESSGGGDRFAAFIGSELLPLIETAAGGSSARILVGHSFGGVNALNILLTQEDTFDAYISIGASTWVADRVLFDRARRRFDMKHPLQSWVYMAVAERDGGATVPDGKEFAQFFAQTDNPELEWSFEVIPETDHFSAVPIGVTRAFMRLFPVWQQKEEARQAAMTGKQQITEWFEREERRLGWRFLPHAWDFMMLAYELHAEGQSEEALAMLKEVIQRHTKLAELLIARGDILSSIGRKTEAQEAWVFALDLMNREGAKAPRTAPVRRRLEQS